MQLHLSHWRLYKPDYINPMNSKQWSRIRREVAFATDCTSWSDIPTGPLSEKEREHIAQHKDHSSPALSAVYKIAYCRAFGKDHGTWLASKPVRSAQDQSEYHENVQLVAPYLRQGLKNLVRGVHYDDYRFRILPMQRERDVYMSCSSVCGVDTSSSMDEDVDVEENSGSSSDVDLAFRLRDEEYDADSDEF